MIGVDLSPYFISMANFRLKEQTDLLVSIHFDMSKPLLFRHTTILQYIYIYRLQSLPSPRFYFSLQKNILQLLSEYGSLFQELLQEIDGFSSCMKQEQKLPVHFMHAAGEYTWLPSGAFDLVSLSLVCHELPRSATKEVSGEILLICALRSLYGYLY